jgi:uncharacterized membrane protein HdeD (DUF308 family)
MPTPLARSWWALVLRGIAALLFAALALLWPGLTFGILLVLFASFAILDGSLAIVAAFKAASEKRRWIALGLEGVVGVVVGILVFTWPSVSAVTLAYLIAFWAIVTGIFELAVAMRMRRLVKGEWTMALGGFASLVFGFIVAARPGTGALAFVWILGAYAALFGVLLIGLGLRLRRVTDNGLLDSSKRDIIQTYD